jgi:hypothetical protein
MWIMVTWLGTQGTIDLSYGVTIGYLGNGGRRNARIAAIDSNATNR